MGRDGGSPMALCGGRRWADRVAVPWASGDRAQAALCRSRRRCALGSSRHRVALARLSSGGRARVRWWRGRQVGHGQGARAGRRTGRAGRAARPELGPRAACPGGERGRVSRGRGEGAGQARGRGEGKKERRGKEREKKRKERRKENGKRKEKEKGGGKKRKKKREGERDPRRDHGADRGAGRPRLASGRARVRCAGRGKIGCRIRVSGLWGFGRSGGTGRIPEDWG